MAANIVMIPRMRLSYPQLAGVVAHTEHIAIMLHVPRGYMCIVRNVKTWIAVDLEREVVAAC